MAMYNKGKPGRWHNSFKDRRTQIIIQLYKIFLGERRKKQQHQLGSLILCLLTTYMYLHLGSANAQVKWKISIEKWYGESGVDLDAMVTTFELILVHAFYDHRSFACSYTLLVGTIEMWIHLSQYCVSFLNQHCILSIVVISIIRDGYYAASSSSSIRCIHDSINNLHSTLWRYSLTFVRLPMYIV